MNTETIPSGWYFCIESVEVARGQVAEKLLFGKKLVFWRTESGVLSISEATCPHLGSNLAKLGRVQGENLQCFSHKYAYNGEGDCVATGFKSLPCRTKQVLKKMPVHEAGGFVLAWYDAESREPTWRIPDEVLTTKGLTPLVRSDFAFDVSLETLNEDNFDVGHLYSWHDVQDVKTTPVERKGPTISIAHAFNRHSIVFKKPLKPPFDMLSREVNSRYSSTLYGHGLTDSFIDIFNFNIRLQDLIWCTPISAGRTMYTTFVRLVETGKYRTAVERVIDAALRPLIFRASVRRLRQEHRVEGHGFWEQQSKVVAPILTASEEALIGPYREWCRQFVTPASGALAAR